ncbi:hypothetical protein OHA98_18745 [Streptomyces sp. NBC_00654]|uniref:hypothetical protein n=1 Tax=Streptomyces sp. NBC_00654 TaxID=2975799 RepID=UPI00225B7F87|nr:hypothetical protein [Streptomyces sp. NBC_00654]MCX4966838.1 hypothetical protein [Streptomyces sp. NBC_00654]
MDQWDEKRQDWTEPDIPEGPPPGIRTARVAVVTAVAVLLCVAVGAGIWAWAPDREPESPGSALPVQTGPSTPDSTQTGPETTDPSDGAESSPTPPSPEDEAFAGIGIDDCLDNFNDLYGAWSPETPQAASCSGSYYRVMSIVNDSTECSEYDYKWSHANDDLSETVFCLNRNFRAGQCMFADEEERLSRNAITPCDGDIPDDYKYIIKITGVTPNGGDCEDSSWTFDEHGIAVCGKKV